MKIAVISDTHFGYAYGSEREEDSFRQANEAIERAIQERVDLILLPGDIFDARIPRQEVLARALDIFQKPLLAEKNSIKLVKTLGKQGISPMVFSGIPVVSIYGTHERRGAHSTNPVQTLEHGGYLINLHCKGLVFEVDGKRVCIQGLSGVPEKDAKDVIEGWNPRPEQGCFNIFMFHQSIEGYVYSDEEGSMLKFEDLPRGFDLYIDGHIHTHHEVPDKHLLIAGSTILTQQKKADAGQHRGFYIIEIDGAPKFSFIELKSQRPFYYREFSFQDASFADVVKQARSYLEDIVRKQHELKPQIMLKFTGKLQQGKDAKNVNADEITKGFEAIVTINNQLESEDFKKKIEQLRELQQKKLSAEEQGMQLIEELLKEGEYEGIPPGEIIDALAEGENDVVIQKILERFERASS